MATPVVARRETGAVERPAGGTARDTVRAGYDRAAASYTDSRARQPGEDLVLLDALLAGLQAGRRVLDAGCGAGIPVAERIVAAGHAVTGLDLSFGQLALARDHVPACPTVQGDLATLPFPRATFDVVVSFYAIIHVPREEHAEVFAELRRVLRPGGTALLCLGWVEKAADHDPDSWLGVPMYWSHFAADTNLALLAGVGLRVESSREVTDPMGHASHQFVVATAP